MVIAARGTSDNAARYAQYLFGVHNQLQVALATPSLFTLYNTPPDLSGALVIGISQSGQSPDIVSVLAEGKRQGCPTLAITNEPASPLAQTAGRGHPAARRAGTRHRRHKDLYHPRWRPWPCCPARFNPAASAWSSSKACPQLMQATLAQPGPGDCPGGTLPLHGPLRRDRARLQLFDRLRNRAEGQGIDPDRGRALFLRRFPPWADRDGHPRLPVDPGGADPASYRKIWQNYSTT